ncbi:MAG TPA: DUF58 domain-containing protein [Alphaproteobacteria bacterium]|nr:DUF58 domain-containing protein [Alphaproteobacteria bacterium]
MPPSAETLLLHRAEAAADRLPPLLVAAERVAAAIQIGIHGRKRAGPGETFWQFRPYREGDPASKVDWRRSAKGDRLYIREREWEAAQTVWLWRDASPSMDYRSHKNLTTKRERAEILLLALAIVLVRAGERVALLGGEPPTTTRAGIDRMAIALAHNHGALGSTPGLPSAEGTVRYARFVAFGDFLDPVEETATRLRAHASRGVKGHLVQVFDPAEETLPFAGRVRFEGPESEGETLIERADSLRDAYSEKLAAHRAGLAQTCSRLDFTFDTHRTDQPASSALLPLFAAIGERD